MKFMLSLSFFVLKDSDLEVLYYYFFNTLRLELLFIEWGAMDNFDKWLPSLPQKSCSEGATPFLGNVYLSIATASIVSKLSITM